MFFHESFGRYDILLVCFLSLWWLPISVLSLSSTENANHLKTGIVKQNKTGIVSISSSLSCHIYHWESAHQLFMKKWLHNSIKGKNAILFLIFLGKLLNVWLFYFQSILWITLGLTLLNEKKILLLQSVIWRIIRICYVQKGSFSRSVSRQNFSGEKISINTIQFPFR